MRGRSAAARWLPLLASQAVSVLRAQAVFGQFLPAPLAAPESDHDEQELQPAVAPLPSWAELAGDEHVRAVRRLMVRTHMLARLAESNTIRAVHAQALAGRAICKRGLYPIITCMSEPQEAPPQIPLAVTALQETSELLEVLLLRDNGFFLRVYSVDVSRALVQGWMSPVSPLIIEDSSPEHSCSGSADALDAVSRSARSDWSRCAVLLFVILHAQAFTSDSQGPGGRTRRRSAALIK
jgi:hypothetical protein